MESGINLYSVENQENAKTIETFSDHTREVIISKGTMIPAPENPL